MSKKDLKITESEAEVLVEDWVADPHEAEKKVKEDIDLVQKITKNLELTDVEIYDWQYTIWTCDKEGNTGAAATSECNHFTISTSVRFTFKPGHKAADLIKSFAAEDRIALVNINGELKLI